MPGDAVTTRSGRSAGMLLWPEPGRKRHAYRLEPAVHVELGEDVAGVRAHGVGRDQQFLGNLPAPLSVHHAQQNIAFARAEHAQRIIEAARPVDVGPQLTHYLAEHVGREPRVTLAYAAQ